MKSRFFTRRDFLYACIRIEKNGNAVMTDYRYFFVSASILF